MQQARVGTEGENPAHGSGGMIQFLSNNDQHASQKNPTNGSWWFVQILSNNNQHASQNNPTNGSWSFVQIPSNNDQHAFPEQSHQLPLVGFLR
jgi:hypothetical protein